MLSFQEVQRTIHEMDSSPNGVNRSASCVSEHVTSGAGSGLPRRADTFGGFDSQQRSAVDFNQSVNSKVLFQVCCISLHYITDINRSICSKSKLRLVSDFNVDGSSAGRFVWRNVSANGAEFNSKCLPKSSSTPTPNGRAS